MNKKVKIGIIAVLLLVALFAIYFLTKSATNSSPISAVEQAWKDANPGKLFVGVGNETV